MQKKVENISLEFETCFEHYFKILFWIFKLKSKIKARKKISIINIDNETKRNEKNKFEIVFFQFKINKQNVILFQLNGIFVFLFLTSLQFVFQHVQMAWSCFFLLRGYQKKKWWELDIQAK